ncbi:MAG: valine--tRNA ligase [Parcubacteria group bacterium]|nr:valine--tRNA ligase [Parcubacteria group bacterium]
MDLPKAYNPKEVEDKIYKRWEESGFFTPEKTKKSGPAGFFQKKFVATIAPPNITGELHMGHALEHTLEDIIVRMKRMQGFEVLWLPGLDHAGIATQNVVEKELKKEGLTRHDLGREKFLERVWEWVDKYGSAILGQFKKLGLSLDWSRKRFTLDEDYQKAVAEAFSRYQKRGWIYEGWRVINWCPRCQSAISDLEVEYKETKGKLYFIKYPLAGGNGFITVATTRPETMLGDSAVAVNPNDERHKNLIGEKAVLPIQERKIPIIADEKIDLAFGTGAVKVTPAHSVDDFEISEKHRAKRGNWDAKRPTIQIYQVIDKNGKMTREAGPLCEGLKTADCREKVLEKLQELGLLEKTEDLIHNLGHCERCGALIEPLYSKQWFLKMKELAESAKKAVKTGLIQIRPEKWAGSYLDWLENIRDWNISRQLWWGHPIPGSEDVLDTWFSSALWAFAALGWPSFAKATEGTARKNDYKNFYPTQFITSGRDILHLWITRMVFSGIELTAKAPFKKVYIHPTVLTKDGQRMSKSLGTGIDPIGLIEKYGADALRFGLAFQTTGVQDMRFNEDVIDAGKKFANKIWNASRFVLMQLEPDREYDLKLPQKSDTMDAEFVRELKSLIKSTEENIENFRFGQAADGLYHFFWDRFAAVYIEDAKEKLKSEAKTKKLEVMLWLLANQLKLLHPFMPFITEEIWSNLPINPPAGGKKMLLIEPWPR